ncbi:MAG: hypothetical protein J6J18_06015, partial [Oscillospiraceae bacterium]|nr:hypothetical protein [Oscillospiraceae bacterium]
HFSIFSKCNGLLIASPFLFRPRWRSATFPSGEGTRLRRQQRNKFQFEPLDSTIIPPIGPICKQNLSVHKLRLNSLQFVHLAVSFCGIMMEKANESQNGGCKQWLFLF